MSKTKTRALALPIQRFILASSLLSLGVLGCATLIGLDEYTVASHAGAAGVLQTGGNGGQSEAGGAAGSAVGEAVGCDGKTAFEPNLDIVRSCLLRAGCDPTFAPVRTISTCVTYDTQEALPGESCNLHAKTCADFEACEHVGVAHEDLCGNAVETGTRCEGDKAINCGNYPSGDRFFDCAALGGTCNTLTFSDGQLYADCELEIAPDSCAGQADTDAAYFCHSEKGRDDLRYYCWQGKAFGSSCSSLATCADNPRPADGGEAGAAGAASAVGNATCYFNTQACVTPTTPTCDSGVATVCSEGALFKYNCGAVGLSCSVDSEVEYCLAPGCAPADVDGDCQEVCSDDGTKLTFCYGGAPYTVSCADYGFSRCQSGTSDGQAFAACRF